MKIINKYVLENIKKRTRLKIYLTSLGYNSYILKDYSPARLDLLCYHPSRPSFYVKIQSVGEKYRRSNKFAIREDCLDWLLKMKERGKNSVIIFENNESEYYAITPKEINDYSCGLTSWERRSTVFKPLKEEQEKKEKAGKLYSENITYKEASESLLLEVIHYVLVGREHSKSLSEFLNPDLEKKESTPLERLFKRKRGEPIEY